jgi:hypothetical protein
MPWKNNWLNGKMSGILCCKNTNNWVFHVKETSARALTDRRFAWYYNKKETREKGMPPITAECWPV